MNVRFDEHQLAVREAVRAFCSDRMGFTLDMLPRYFLKRAWVLEHLFGSASWYATRVGESVGEEVAVS